MATNENIRAGDNPDGPKAPTKLPKHKPGAAGGQGAGTNPEFEAWWAKKQETTLPFFPGFDKEFLHDLALAAWKQGLDKPQLNALLGQKAENLFAFNAGGGAGEPSPYQQYFLDNPDQIPALVGILQSDQGVIGPQQQQALFDTFSGLQESYLGSLGLELKDGKVIDPTDPNRTPWLAEQKRRQEQGITSIFDHPGSTGSPSAPGVYMNVNPDIPYTESLAPMRNRLAGMFNAAATSGDSEQIAQATQSMQDYSGWLSNFEAFSQTTDRLMGGLTSPRSKAPFDLKAVQDEAYE